MKSTTMESKEIVAEIFFLLDQSDIALIESESKKAIVQAGCLSLRMQLSTSAEYVDVLKSEIQQLSKTIEDRDSEIRHLRHLLSLWPARLMLKAMRFQNKLKKA